MLLINIIPINHYPYICNKPQTTKCLYTNSVYISNITENICNMKSDFDYQAMPISFGHCLNKTCLRADKCLRHQMALRIPKEREFVQVLAPDHVSPTGEDCIFFIDEKPLLYARGMTHLLDHVIMKEAQVLKRLIFAHMGNNNYYRSMNKERLIKPQEQAYIKKLFQSRGITEPPIFDEYVEYYDLG